MTTPSTVYRVAAVQMISGVDVAANLAQAEPLIAEAADKGAQLVLLPENFGFMGLHAKDKIAIRERDGDGIQQTFLSTTAGRHRIVLIGGSVPIACDDPTRIRQALLVYGPDGARIARYDKVHLFRFTQGDENYDEAKTISAGEIAQSFEARCGRVGLSICYDVRFPELYRKFPNVA